MQQACSIDVDHLFHDMEGLEERAAVAARTGEWGGHIHYDSPIDHWELWSARGTTTFNYNRGLSRCYRKSISDSQYIGSISISDDLIFMPQSYLLRSFSIACLAQAGVVGCTRIVSTTFAMSISTLIPCG